MYFPVGWPKVLASAHAAGTLVQVICNRDKILFAVLSNNQLEIWFCKVCDFVCVARLFDRVIFKIKAFEMLV